MRERSLTSIDLDVPGKSCLHNAGVLFGPSCVSKANAQCDKCGWNPIVSAKRMKRICKEMEVIRIG